MVVQDVAEYAPDDLPNEVSLKVRGATDFLPGFEWLDEQGIEPAVCLYFTDMECSSRVGLPDRVVQLDGTSLRSDD